MKRYATAVAFVVLFAIGAIAAAAMAGKSPAALMSSHTTGTTGTTTTATTGTTTVPTTTTTPRPGKVTICHHTGSRKNPHRQITVSQSALAAHLRHGDTPAPCPARASVTQHNKAAHVKKFHKNKTLSAELRAEAKAKSKSKAAKSKGKGKGKAKGRR